MVLASHPVTTFRYSNRDDSPEYQTGFLYCDHETGTVQWQCGDAATCWHGSRVDVGAVLLISFDAMGGRRGADCTGSPRPKTATLERKSGGLHYEGHDYRGRRVSMTPAARWRRDVRTDEWVQTAEWSSVTNVWLQIVRPA